MFGLIVAGRPVDAAPQEIGPGKYIFTIPAAPRFNHIVVFQLPGTALPQGYAAGVFVQFAGSEGRFLGGLDSTKASAIFKVSGINDAPSSNDVDLMTDGPGNSLADNQQSLSITVGISIETEGDIAIKVAELQGQTSSALVRATPAVSNNITTKQLAKNIIGNAFDFLASFGSDTVPLKAFQDWWNKFEKKIDLDPSFLERTRNG